MIFENTLLVRLPIILLMSIWLFACGNDGKKSSDVKTQVVAKVNGDEISIHQVNQQLSRLGTLGEEKAQQASRQILDRLIDMQLLEQKAKEAELDRDPQVLQAIEASRKQILAQAYIQKKMLNSSQPTEAEVDSFYNEHPELFAERRVFNLQELAIEGASDKVALIEEAVANKSNISDVAEWLKGQGLKFALNANVRAAEQLPSKLLENLNPLKQGDMLTIVNGQSVNVISIAAVETLPVTKEKAMPVIQKYFQNKHKKETLETQMAALRSAADIELVGVFSESIKSDTAEQPQVEKIEETDGVDVSPSLDKALEGF